MSRFACIPVVGAVLISLVGCDTASKRASHREPPVRQPIPPQWTLPPPTGVDQDGNAPQAATSFACCPHLMATCGSS